jgi:predicted XRE-type DNA-binding protein
MISTLVMLAFVGKKPPQHYIAYRDGNRHNCRLENIYYAPNQERWNAVSKKRKEKSKSFKRKVNRKQYNLIFKSIVARYVRLVQSGTMTQAQAASKLGIHYSTMSRYCSGQTPLFNKRFHTFFTLGIDTYP